MTNLVRSNFQDHPFHLVSPSPWPLYTSISLFTITVNAALSMHLFSNSYIFFYLALATVVASMTLWFRDIISEGTYLGNHTLAVQKGLNLGVILFIVSEALFFLAIFWAFFHSALTPTVELGAQWPPIGIEPINPFELPLLNTVILLSSGATITYAHHVRGLCLCITSQLRDINFSYVYAALELGKGESPELNTASQEKKTIRNKPSKSE